MPKRVAMLFLDAFCNRVSASINVETADRIRLVFPSGREFIEFVGELSRSFENLKESIEVFRLILSGADVQGGEVVSSILPPFACDIAAVVEAFLWTCQRFGRADFDVMAEALTKIALNVGEELGKAPSPKEEAGGGEN